MIISKYMRKNKKILNNQDNDVCCSRDA